MRDLSHSSNAHTALMEGKEPIRGHSPASPVDTFPLCCCCTSSCILYVSVLFFFLCPVFVGILVLELLIENVLPLYPLLLIEFAKLIQTMWTSSPNDVVSPSEFKTQIQRYAPRFVGYK